MAGGPLGRLVSHGGAHAWDKWPLEAAPDGSCWSLRVRIASVCAPLQTVNFGRSMAGAIPRQCASGALDYVRHPVGARPGNFTPASTGKACSALPDWPKGISELSCGLLPPVSDLCPPEPPSQRTRRRSPRPDWIGFGPAPGRGHESPLSQAGGRRSHRLLLPKSLATRIQWSSWSLARTDVDAMAEDLEAARTQAGAPERLLLLSAQRAEHPLALNFSAGLRELAGGTLSALNARVLLRLAERAGEHGFAPEGMRRALVRMIESTPSWQSPERKHLNDSALEAWITRTVADDPEVSATRALRCLRSQGLACEQGRFRKAFSEAQERRDAKVAVS